MKKHSEGKRNRARFIQLIAGIEKVMNTHRTSIVWPVTKPTSVRSVILKNLIFSEISDLAIILDMVFRDMEELGQLDETMRGLQKIVPLGTVDRSTPEGNQLVLTMTRQHRAMSELRIHMETIYEWLYHVKNLINGHPTLLSQIESSTCWEKLKSYCEFRSKLVTHKRGMYVIPMRWARYSAMEFSTEIVLMPLVPSNSAVTRLSSLFAQCASIFTGDEANEGNFFERYKILFHNRDKLTNNLREQVVSFVRKYGTISAQSIDLAEFAQNLAGYLIPKLANL